MNINLSGTSSQTSSKKQGKGKALGFGLNKRKKNVFDDDDDDDDDSNEGEGNNTQKSKRDAVNREIAKEQAALRKRALKAMSQQQQQGSAGNGNLYDYDGAYDSFQPAKKYEKPAGGDDGSNPEEPKRSRYVEDMLKSSKRRAIERDMVYERKVAREQEEESNQADFQGKEKFVTKAYKRKLEERQRLADENAKQLVQDEKEDVTKKRGGAAMASFYGNLNRNVAMGGAGTSSSTNDPAEEEEKGKADSDKEAPAQHKTGPSARESGSRKVHHSEEGRRSSVSSRDRRPSKGTEDGTSSKEAPEPAKKVLSPAELRKAREEKLAAARARYFQRIGKSVAAS